MELGDLIAERSLILRSPNGESESVTVHIGAPQPSPDGVSWLCPYRIHRDTGRVRFAAGVDAVQALDLVTQMIEADLFLLNRQYQGGLCWADGSAYFPEDRQQRASQRRT
jgi:hypothetical protein